MTSIHCKICNSSTTVIFNAKVLGKYPVNYYQCEECQFIQTEQPYWLAESYESAITSLDIGLISRNIHYLPITQAIINKLYNADGQFLDYGGGYGMFVRMMRDDGFNYYRQDDFCDNTFSKYFDVTDLPANSKFELVTAFEVFEHLPDPVTELKRMLEYSTNILFSTEIQPKKALTNPSDWWYFAQETGQHVAFYTHKSLDLLAKSSGLNYYTYGNLHLFTDKKLHPKILKQIIKPGMFSRIGKSKKRTSLLQTDFNYIRNLQA